MQRIIFISKIPISNFPRLLSIPYALSELNYEVIILAPGDFPEVLKSKNNICFEKLHLKDNGDNKWGKLLNWSSFRKTIKRKREKILSGDILWISSADSAIPLFGLLKRYKYILQINELYDKIPVYKFFLKKLSSNAKLIVVPEYNRANILKVWFKLKDVPFVLPNKSIFPQKQVLPDNNLLLEIENIKQIKSAGYKIIIYQGNIGTNRDFSQLLMVLKDIPHKIHLLLVGKDFGMVERYKKLYKGITWIPHVEAPKHLYFTELADIGILYYNSESLNQIFCAPNKTWEYSKFGIPFISNDLPGMLIASEKYNAGKICNFNSPVDIKEALIDLFDNHSIYSTNSKNLYCSVDYLSLVNNIITKAVKSPDIIK